MPFKIVGKMAGVNTALAKLQKLASQTTRSKILRKAVTAAARPMLQQAKATVPVDQGWLKRSLGIRIQTYRQSGVVVAIIGPRTGFQRKKIEGFRRKVHTAFGLKLEAKTDQRPTFYAHLVEFGTRPHSTTKFANLKKKRLQGGGRQHPGAKPEPFLGPSFASQKAAAEETMRRVILEGVEAELK